MAIGDFTRHTCDRCGRTHHQPRPFVSSLPTPPEGWSTISSPALYKDGDLNPDDSTAPPTRDICEQCTTFLSGWWRQKVLPGVPPPNGNDPQVTTRRDDSLGHGK